MIPRFTVLTPTPRRTKLLPAPYLASLHRRNDRDTVPSDASLCGHNRIDNIWLDPAHVGAISMRLYSATTTPLPHWRCQITGRYGRSSGQTRLMTMGMTRQQPFPEQLWGADEARRAKMRCLLVAALLVIAGCASISPPSVRRPSPAPTNRYESRAPRLELLKLAPDTRVRVSSVRWHTPVIGPLAVASERAVSIWSVNSERRIEIPMTEVSTIHANPELKSNASKMAYQGVWGGGPCQVE